MFPKSAETFMKEVYPLKTFFTSQYFLFQSLTWTFLFLAFFTLFKTLFCLNLRIP